MRKASLLLALMLAGVSGAALAQEPERGGTLNMVVQPEPPTVMLGLNKLGPVSFVGSKIYEGLINLAPDMKPLPGLAESWEISEDGLTYTFHLRQGVKWHDGEPFTSRDVVYSFSTFLPEAFARTRSVMARTESITAPDDQTVVFKLKAPYAAFMMIFEVSGGTIVPAHIYEGTNIRENPANEKPIGTGPFQFKEWAKGRYIQLVRNDDYWNKGLPHLDEIYFHVIPDANSRAIAFEQGQVDVLRGGDVENFEVRRLAEAPGVEVSEAGWEFFDPLAIININLKAPPLDNLKVRQAISYAIDRQFMIDAVFGGFGKPAYGPMTERTPFYDAAALTDYSFDMEKAKTLMAESGLKPDANGVYATLDLMPLPYGETWQRQSEYLRQQLTEIGIATNVVSVDVPGWQERTTTGKFHITTNFIYLLGDPAMGVSQTYVSDNQNRGTATNVDGYVNPEIDKLFAEGAATNDPAVRQKVYSEIQKVISADLPVIWSHQMSMPTVYRSKLNNLITTGLGLNSNFADVWIAKD
ncbi:ABC transporter substrate-binding protein [Arvimicrobium flavum]|uniref:ABC transporter substrate-binding protein n=1 Tax=Arvimicrobium flavum TaxID=3393320 RepID=UPI00237A7554|nr:ABC transporter substrate-binding protein [Mesorhizobium shangrilense]